jgi:NAD+ kinase
VGVTSAERTVLLVAHTGRDDIITLAHRVISQLRAAGISVRVLAGEVEELNGPGTCGVPADETAAAGAEMVLVLGGDGSLLRAAELARPNGAPVLGVNLGRVGFLAETEPETIEDTVARIIARDYDLEERLTLDVEVAGPGDEPLGRAWALNEASVEKQVDERIVELVLEVDERPLTTFGGDGVLFATPTGSTAYAFSAGGPVAWPSVQALIVVPNNPHAVFARPLVVAPDSVLVARLSADGHGAVLSCDGRRRIPLPAGATVRVSRGEQPVRLARVHGRPFTDRLVAKFALPVRGFRRNNAN